MESAKRTNLNHFRRKYLNCPLFIVNWSVSDINSNLYYDMLSVFNPGYIKKYNAMVKIALFRSSSQSPAIKSSSSTTIKSPVSKSAGSNCRRNPPPNSDLLYCGLSRGGHSGSGGGQCSFSGCGLGRWGGGGLCLWDASGILFRV